MAEARLSRNFLFAAALASQTLHAQIWSYPDLVDAAQSSYPAVLAKESARKAAAADVEAAGWARYPTPSIEAGDDRNGVKTLLLRVQQPLWTFGKISAGIDSAKGRERASAAAVSETRQDVAQKVIDAYVEALRQKEKLESAKKGTKLHQGLLELIERRVSHEASPRIDEELARSRLMQAENEVSLVKQSLKAALDRLSTLAGKTVADVRALDLPPESEDEKSAQVEAAGRSPTIERISFEEKAAESEVDAKKAAFLPQIGLRYENSYASGAYNGLPAYSSKRFLLVVEAQTGPGLSAGAAVEAAKAKREAVLEERASATRELQEKVAVLYEELRESRSRLANAEAAAKSAKEVYESYARQYTTGRKSWLDVLNTVRESTQQDFAAADAKAQVASATLKLRLLTGKEAHR